MIYFSSDWHLGHSNIIKFCDRPFSSTGEMDKAILDRYCETVKPEDTFYFLGDFSWYNWKRNYEIWSSLPGTKYFIKGNHDKDVDEFIDTSTISNIWVEKNPVTLCHYPMLSWDKSHFGAIQLYGHHHTLDTNSIFPGKRINVACDKWDFRPVSWDTIKRVADKLPNNWDYIEGR